MFLRRPRSTRIAFALAGSLLSSAAAYGQAASFDVGDKGLATQAYFEWCNERLANCVDDLTATDSTVIVMGATEWAVMNSVNTWWNNNHIPTSDIERYKGKHMDKWRVAYKGDKADCEDVVLSKRRTLIEKFKWPFKALLLTLVRDENGEGHAVLTVKTNRGDFILDNRTNEIRPWHKTRLTFISALTRGMWRTVITPKDQPVLPVIHVAFTLGASDINAPRPPLDIPHAGRFAQPRMQPQFRGTFTH